MDSSLYNCIVGKAGEVSLTELKELSLVNQRFSTVDGIGKCCPALEILHLQGNNLQEIGMQNTKQYTYH